MVTVKNFVGAFLHGLTTSRTISDKTSLKVAEHYLQNDYLRGYPVPRMTLKDVDLELKFNVGPSTRLETLLKEPEIRTNITHQFREILTELPNTDLFKSHFGQSVSLDHEWEKGISDLVATMERILTGKTVDKETLIHMLALSVENFFYKIHHKKPGKGVLGGLRSIFTKSEPEPDAAMHSAPVRDWATKQVSSVLDSVIPGGAGESNELLDVNILVGGPELEGQNPENLHTAKISFTSEDRKWVSSEDDGKKSYILSR